MRYQFVSWITLTIVKLHGEKARAKGKGKYNIKIAITCMVCHVEWMQRMAFRPIVKDSS